MAKLCDIIEEFLKEAIHQSSGSVEIQRNELAIKFRCVPSQINYVIATRFTHEKGYYVESRRGGGGHIRIQQVEMGSDANYFMHIITSMGNQISQQQSEIFIQNFLDYDVISTREAMLIRSAISDKVFIAVDIQKRDFVRAHLLKNMITALLV